MAPDQEIAKGVESVLRQSDPNAVNSLNGVVQQVEAKLDLDLLHKAGFMRDQINSLLRSHPQQPQPPPPPQPQQPPQQQQQQPPKDHFALHNHPQFQSTHHHHQHQQHQQQQQQQQHHHHQHQHQQFPSHFSLQAAHPHVRPHHQPLPLPPPQILKPEAFAQNATPHTPKESAPVGAKRRGGLGGLNKVCGVSPELQAIFGELALPRTEILKQLWAYIRQNNLQDPSNKRKIICDNALRVVFEIVCTVMFKMNKLLAKHIIAVEPTKESSQDKRLKVDVESTIESVQRGSSPVVISEALAKFLGPRGREMPQSEAITLVWEYIKVNCLEWLGLSRVLEDPQDLISSTETNPSRLNRHLRRVGDGSQSLEPDPGGSRGGFYPQKSDPPDPPDKTSKRRLKSGDVWASQLHFNHVWPSFTQIRSNLHSDMLKLGKCSRDLLKLGQTPVSSTLTRPNLVRFRPKLGHISIDMKEYRPNLVKSG